MGDIYEIHTLGCIAGLMYLHTKLVNYSRTFCYLKRKLKTDCIVETAPKTGKVATELYEKGTQNWGGGC